MLEDQEFNIVSEYKLAGDQPNAVSKMTQNLRKGIKNQVLLGVTGSGKTFSMAHTIERLQKPTLIMAPNKTLAAQLYGEMKELFPYNAVEYFVSYYDYYQPEAYIPRSDIYIEKDASINEQIDLLRHSATRSLLERRDVIVVSSVSCIYGLGAPELYASMKICLNKDTRKSRASLLKELVDLQYTRNEFSFSRGTFRAIGDVVDILPSHLSDRGWKIEFFGDEIDSITEFDSLTNEKIATLPEVTIYANSHYVTPKPTIENAIKHIKKDLVIRLDDLRRNNKLVEAQRLQQRTEFDIEMMVEAGTCKGIENYSRYLSGRNAGDPPPTLFEYLPKDALLFMDESHVSVSQVNAMYKGDRSRKSNLVEYGFRLPSAMDNRPLTFAEWDDIRPKTIFVSATPARFELDLVGNKCIEQIIRPTGLMDPECIVRPSDNQVDDLINEVKKVVAKNERVLVTTLTKKMAEKLTEYLAESGIKVSYLHSEINVLERIGIIRDLRRGDIDVLVGINLLREGLDIPECTLVAILDADKEGFLRSETSLVQIIGRVARNINGRAILYGNKETKSMKNAIAETNRRRKIQMEYNERNNITPKSIRKNINDALCSIYEQDSVMISLEEESADALLDSVEINKKIKQLKSKMIVHAENLEFEKAASLRDEIHSLEGRLLS